MNGATIFSKIDLNKGYHQLELHPESRYITTFTTHKGLYRYKRLSFGINSAAETFQKKISDVIQNIRGARNISDDIIIFGKTQEEHDAVLTEVMERLREHNITVGKDKCEFGKPEFSLATHSPPKGSAQIKRKSPP